MKDLKTPFFKISKKYKGGITYIRPEKQPQPKKKRVYEVINVKGKAICLEKS